jgi:hypothetical protein
MTTASELINEICEAKSEGFDKNIKGKKVIGNGFRNSFKNGVEGTLTGKFGGFIAGKGYDYEVELEDGKMIWVDGQGFKVGK